ncbi:hypothetical protein T484DRAFT_1856645 [Baffinella frigidus]|nr:hypothetical protein T484DRAFT_1856645 [Cryptophyta sp. CCMP2293]
MLPVLNKQYDFESVWRHAEEVLFLTQHFSNVVNDSVRNKCLARRVSAIKGIAAAKVAASQSTQRADPPAAGGVAHTHVSVAHTPSGVAHTHVSVAHTPSGVAHTPGSVVHTPSDVHTDEDRHRAALPVEPEGEACGAQEGGVAGAAGGGHGA